MPYCTVQYSYSYEYEYRVRAPRGSVTSVLTLSQALLKPSSSPLAAFTGVVLKKGPFFKTISGRFEDIFKKSGFQNYSNRGTNPIIEDIFKNTYLQNYSNRGLKCGILGIPYELVRVRVPHASTVPYGTVSAAGDADEQSTVKRTRTSTRTGRPSRQAVNAVTGCVSRVSASAQVQHRPESGEHRNRKRLNLDSTSALLMRLRIPEPPR